jgi:hypothetical protein
MSQRRNGQAPGPVIDPDLLRIMAQQGGPPPLSGQIAYSVSGPSPCGQASVIAHQIGDKLVFFGFGGVTNLEAESLKMAHALVGCVGVDDIPVEAVKLTRRIFELCRAVEDPYQGMPQRPPAPPGEEKPAIITE